MRLIDLDKIDVFHQEDEDIVFDIIHAIPVDAIPIEWIEEQLKNMSDRANELNNFNPNKCKEMLNDMDIIRRLFEKWRKENEDNN